MSGSALQLEEPSDWEPRDYVENVYAAFRRSSNYADMVSRRTRWIVADDANEFHVDVVPYIVRAPSCFITNRHENQLELTNPEGSTPGSTSRTASPAAITARRDRRGRRIGSAL